jgi:GT2 family glycosyltransferase
LSLARGEYLIYLHADDVWYEGILRKEVQLLEENKAVTVVHTAEKLLSAQGKVIKINKSPRDRITQGSKAFRDYFRLGWYFSFSSCMMRRSVLTEIGGFDPAFGLLTDAGTFLRLCLAGEVAFINECLVGYRLHGESLSSGLLVGGKYFQEQKKLLDIVFSWPATQAEEVQRYKHSILASLALTIVKLSHIAKIEMGTGEVVKWLKDAFRMSPRVVLSPVVWIRVPLVFLLPGTTLQWLQGIKRKAELARSA